jgi:6-phosphogluconolactonase (cycloisomerase 2 family)
MFAASLWIMSFGLSLSVEAVHLYVASYSGGNSTGNITTLSLFQKPDSSYSLLQTSTLNTSTNSPSWLTLNRHNKILYMVDEAINITTSGTIVAYKTDHTGRLAELSRTKAPIGGVDATFYASGNGLAVPHYTGSALVTYKITRNGGLEPLETFSFLSASFKVGPVEDRQESPHPHQAILDPTENYILIPDLGADVVHVFRIDQENLKLTAREPLRTHAGFGPRHGTFSLEKMSGNYIFYLVSELDNKVVAYCVSYQANGDGLMFREIASYGTLSPGVSFPRNNDGSSKVAPAEISFTVSCVLLQE